MYSAHYARQVGTIIPTEIYTRTSSSMSFLYCEATDHSIQVQLINSHKLKLDRSFIITLIHVSTKAWRCAEKGLVNSLLKVLKNCLSHIPVLSGINVLIQLHDAKSKLWVVLMEETTVHLKKYCNFIHRFSSA